MMIKKYLCLSLCLLLVSPSQGFAKQLLSGNPDKQPPVFANADEQAYLAMKEKLDAEEKKNDKSLKESLSATVARVQSVVTSFPRVNRGDPKTSYDQSENRLHSEKNRESKPKTSDGSKNAGVNLSDTKKWVYSGDIDYAEGFTASLYTSLTNGYYDVVMVIYDSATGEAVEARGLKTVEVFEEPDLSGMTFFFEVQLPANTTVKKYGLYTDSGNINDIRKWVFAYYTTSTDDFLYARVQTIDDLSLNKVRLPD